MIGDRGRRPQDGSARTPAVVSCHVERPLNDAIWERFSRLQSSCPGGFRIAALVRPPAPEASEPEDLWLKRFADARERGPLGHHTHFGGVDRAGPPEPRLAPDRLRREAEWLRERDLFPRFWCGGGWHFTPTVADVLADFGYVDCTATAFPLEYARSDAGYLRLPAPCWLLLADGRRLLELPATHSLGMAARLALSPRPMTRRAVHVYFHDWDLLDRRRAAALRGALVALGRRFRPLDLDRLADEVARDAPDVPLLA